jgi:hypothetical protein
MAEYDAIGSNDRVLERDGAWSSHRHYGYQLYAANGLCYRYNRYG